VDVVWQFAETFVVLPTVVPVPEQSVLLVPAVVYAEVHTLVWLVKATARTVKDFLLLSFARHERTTANNRTNRATFLTELIEESSKIS